MLRKRARPLSPELLPSNPETVVYLLTQAIHAYSNQLSLDATALLDQAETAMDDYLVHHKATPEECVLLLRIYNEQVNCHMLAALTAYDGFYYDPDPSLQLITKITTIHKINSTISDLDFQLITAKAYLLSGYLARQLDEPQRRIENFTVNTERGIAMLDHLFGEGHERAWQMQNIHSRFHDLSQCYFYIAMVYSTLGDGQLCLSYMQRAIDSRLRCDQNHLYFDYLLEIYGGLFELVRRNMFVDAYFDIFEFGYQLLQGDALFEFDENAVEFYRLSKLYQSMVENLSSNSGFKLAFVMQIFQIIRRGLEAGAFSKSDQSVWAAHFPRTPLTRDELSEPYYQKKFLEMSDQLQALQGDFVRLASRPELVFSLQLELREQRSVQKALLAKVARLEQQLAGQARATIGPGFFSTTSDRVTEATDASPLLKPLGKL